MENFDNINGDLLDIELYNKLYPGYKVYICHQCNCTSTTGRGLAVDVFKLVPKANVYKHKHNTQLSIRGTIDIFDNSNNTLNVVNMYAQWGPGKCSLIETAESREILFKMCLDQLKDQLKDQVKNQPVIIAFPMNIGCGLAGGDWSKYQTMINSFAIDIKTIVVKL